MRRIGNLIERIADYDNIQLAFMKARRGKMCSKEVNDFIADYDNSISQIRSQLISANVNVGNYRYFYITDPKLRKICAASFYERVLHHAIMNVCHEYFDRNLIYDTYATRPGKGVYDALNRAKYYLARNDFVLKLDYRKYFDSISHSVLKSKLRRIYKDKRLLEIFDKIIDSYCVTPGYGLPIGNLTSQYFANFYLSELDHELKEKMKVPGYIRYMDDILILSNEKQELKNIFDFISDISATKLYITLKPPLYASSLNGVSFLGYKVTSHYILMNGRSKKRFRQKLLYYMGEYGKGNMTEKDLSNHLLPLLAFTEHSSSFNFRKSCMEILGCNQML